MMTAICIEIYHFLYMLARICINPACLARSISAMPWADKSPAYTSIFAALSALLSMKSRLGSTSSPISIVNT